jgi:hypothetical protein
MPLKLRPFHCCLSVNCFLFETLSLFHVLEGHPILECIQMMIFVSYITSLRSCYLQHINHRIMAVTQLFEFRTAIRDIAIVTIFFAANLAISHHVRGKTISGIGVTNRASQSVIKIMTRKFKLFTFLPVEIRELVYEHAMCIGGHLSHSPYEGRLTSSSMIRGHSKYLPAMCFTSKVERQVAIAVFIHNTTFHIAQEEDAAIMTSWLRKLDRSYGFRSVRKVQLNHVPSQWLTGFNAHFELLRQCPGLRELTIMIPLEPLSLYVYNDAHVLVLEHPLTSNELLDKFQIAGLLDCANLQSVTFKIGSEYTFEFASRLPMYGKLKELIQTMKIDFANRHRRALRFAIALSSEQGRVLGYL